MKFKFFALVLTLSTSFGVYAAEVTPAKIETLPKFTAQDCTLWKGGEGYENDSVPKVYSEHVEAVIEFLNSHAFDEAMRAIQLYCNTPGLAK